jgi:hypothetical protein
MKFRTVVLVSVICLLCSASGKLKGKPPIDEVVVQPGGEMDEGVKNEERDSMLYGPVKENGARNIAWRSSKLDEKVEVEGLALGKSPELQVVYDGSKMFVRSVVFKDREIDGRLVRVKGTLRFQEGTLIRKRDQNGNGYRSITSQPYFYIEASSVEVIDRVTNPRLVSQDL